MTNRAPYDSIPAEVNKHSREISIPRPPEKLAEAITNARRCCSQASALLSNGLETVRRQYQRGYLAWFGTKPDHADPEIFSSFDRVLWIGAFCLMAFECVCAAILAVMTLAVPPVAAVVAGIILTAVFTLTMKSVWHLHVARDEDQPRRALATLYRILMPLFITWAASLAVVLLLPRLVEESTWTLNLAFNIFMSMLAVLSPALSGLLFTAANLYSWSRSLTKRYHSLVLMLKSVEGLVEKCENTSSNVHLLAGRRDSATWRTVVPIAILTMGLLGGHSAEAQSRGEFWLDDSGSVHQAELASAEDQFFRELPAAINSHEASSWDLFRFSREAANARPLVRLRIEPFQEPQCQAPRADEITRLFRRPQIAAEHSQKEGCARLQKDARSSYDRETLKKISLARLDFDAASPAIGVCTALLDLLNRVASEAPARAPAVVVIVTDAIESCARDQQVRVAPPMSSLRTLMVVVPTNAANSRATPWQEFELRKAWLKNVAPWVQPIRIPALTAALLR